MDVVPLTALDFPSKDIVMTFAFVIPARLDPAKLRESLFVAIAEKLPRAGARVAYRNGVSSAVSSTPVCTES